MAYFRRTWPSVKITPKLHMLEDHVVDFIAKWGAGLGYYGEQGGESLHAQFNVLNKTYSAVKNNKCRLEYILKEHYCRVNPEAKALEPVVKKRKIKSL